MQALQNVNNSVCFLLYICLENCWWFFFFFKIIQFLFMPGNSVSVKVPEKNRCFQSIEHKIYCSTNEIVCTIKLKSDFEVIQLFCFTGFWYTDFWLFTVVGKQALVSAYWHSSSKCYTAYPILQHVKMINVWLHARGEMDRQSILHISLLKFWQIFCKVIYSFFF